MANVKKKKQQQPKKQVMKYCKTIIILDRKTERGCRVKKERERESNKDLTIRQKEREKRRIKQKRGSIFHKVYNASKFS